MISRVDESSIASAKGAFSRTPPRASSIAGHAVGKIGCLLTVGMLSYLISRLFTAEIVDSA